MTSASVLGGVLATLRDLPLAGVGDALVRGGALAALGAIAVLLHVRSRWPLRQVRMVEAVVFLVLTLYLLWNSTVFGFGLLTVAYPERSDVLATALELGATMYDAVFITLTRSHGVSFLTSERQTTPWGGACGGGGRGCAVGSRFPEHAQNGCDRSGYDRRDVSRGRQG